MFGNITTHATGNLVDVLSDALALALASAPTFDTSTGADRLNMMRARVALYANVGNGRQLVATAPIIDTDERPWVPVRYYATDAMGVHDFSDMRAYALASDFDIARGRVLKIEGVRYKRNAAGNPVPRKASAKRLFLDFVGEDIVKQMCNIIDTNFAIDTDAPTFKRKDIEVRLEILATSKAS